MSGDFAGRLSEVISLRRLRHELQRFAHEHELPTHNFDDPEAWRQFSRLYAEVVREVPLASRQPLPNVEGFVITRDGVEEVYGPGAPPDSFCWQVRLREGRVVHGAFLYY